MNAQPRIIEPVGSATSLITREWIKSAQVPDSDLAALMLSAILIDTVNLKKEYGRTTPVDELVSIL